MTDPSRILTDIMYKTLFDKDTAELSQHFGVPYPADTQDNDIRDRMGILALEALIQVEKQMVKVSWGINSFEQMKIVTRMMSKHYAGIAKQQAEKAGVDLLTGQ